MRLASKDPLLERIALLHALVVLGSLLPALVLGVTGLGEVLDGRKLLEDVKQK